MICPLMTAGRLANGYVETDKDNKALYVPTAPIKCYKEECGFWNKVIQGCGFSVKTGDMGRTYN